MTSHDSRKAGNTWAGEEDTGEPTGGNNQTNQERQHRQETSFLCVSMPTMKARAKPIQINRKQVAPEVAPPMIIAPNEGREGTVSPFMLLSLGGKMQVYCSLVLLWCSHTSALTFLELPCRPRRENRAKLPGATRPRKHN